MEAQLEDFRRRKESAKRKEELKGRVRAVWDNVTGRLTAALLPAEETETQEEEVDEGESEGAEGIEEESYKVRLIRWTLLTLTWLSFWVAFIKVEFGAVYFATSLLFLIYWNTRTGRRRRRGEVSAYSVFNKDCQAIDGALKPEQLEKQLLFR